MTSKTFVSGTTIDSAWLNDVNNTTYTTVPAHTTKLSHIVDVVADFGASTSDATGAANLAAFNSAVASFGGIGGVIKIPRGQYKLSGVLTLARGITLQGEGQIGGATAQFEGITSLLGVHTGVAVVSLLGCIGCTITDLSIEAGIGAVPKTGLMLGRSSSASAGYHKIKNVAVYGYYSAAPIYSIASEDNQWSDINVWLFGGGAKYCLYTGISDGLATGAGLTSSSNLDNAWYRTFLINSSTDANAACIFIQGAQAVGSWSFFGAYLTAYAGSYIQIDNGTVDSLDCIGPFTFMGVSGEILSGGAPTYGLRLTSTGTRTLPGLTMLGTRFAFLAGATNYQIIQPGNLYLQAPNIHIKPPEAFPYALCSLQRQLITDGNVTVGRWAEWAAPTFSGTWANVYGSPYAAAGYSCDGFGVVRLRGTVGGGTGTIFTLPSDLWPATDMFFLVYATAGVGRVHIIAATGAVTLASGTATEVDLSSIQFKIN